MRLIRKRCVCGKCTRFVKVKKVMSTEYEIKELNYPKEYVTFICSKCGVLNIHQLEG